MVNETRIDRGRRGALDSRKNGPPGSFYFEQCMKDAYENAVVDRAALKGNRAGPVSFRTFYTNFTMGDSWNT